jgi:hypothetical protein
MEKQKKSVFERLSAINVNDKTEKKKDLTYLSWAWAWAEVKKACPDATYKIGQTECMTVGGENIGFMCHTEVTIEGETLAMWLPVMDGANKSMKNVPYTYSTRYGDKQVEAATTFDINKTMMRCLVKNLAMFGLGLYIFAGEDLPEDNTEVVVKPKAVTPPANALLELKLDHENWANVIKYVSSNKQMGLEKLCQQLGRKYKISDDVRAEITKIINL